MSKKDEALKLALVAERVLKAWDDPQGMPALCEEMNCLREALADSALDRMAENERELGIQMQPAQPIKQGWDVDTLLNKPKQPAQQQEPYGWKVYGVNSLFMGEFAEADAKAEAKRIGGTCITFPLYTSPPTSKPWVGLTEEEIDTWNIVGHESLREFVRAIEAKLREKNA